MKNHKKNKELVVVSYKLSKNTAGKLSKLKRNTTAEKMFIELLSSSSEFERIEFDVYRKKKALSKP